MRFKFDITLSDNDYFDYIVFMVMKSPYGKKQIIKFRVIIAVMLLAFCFISLWGGGFTAEAFLGIIPYLAMLILVEILFAPIFAWILKSQIKSLKKSGKMAYSPSASIEFFDEEFIEISEENRIESKYSTVERVSVIKGEAIYIHVNNAMSYILPSACFESDEQREDFLAFIKTKCENVDVYGKR